MQPNFQRNILTSYTVRDLTAIYFENYAISCVSLFPIEEKDYFGKCIEGKFYEKLEGKIVIKAWLELPSLFPGCKLGQYGLKENEFSGILTIDNRLSQDNSRKLIPIIISSFKSRSTKLLNQFHGKHGRIFWENNYREFDIENLNDLNNALVSIKTY
jgi:hypothetical protein